MPYSGGSGTTLLMHKAPGPALETPYGPGADLPATVTKEQVLMGHATDQDAERPSPALTAYAQASQNCRDIARQVGVRNCDDDPTWRQAERDAETAWNAAEAAGHTVDEILAAGRPQA